MNRWLRHILLALVFLPISTFAQLNAESVLLTNKMYGQTTLLSINVLFWSKVIVLLLIVILGIFAYKKFISKKEH
jgi:hypothetical protein